MICVECTHCHWLCATINKSCTKCGTLFKQKRAYWLRFSVTKDGVRKRWKERLGEVSLGLARQIEAERIRSLEVQDNKRPPEKLSDVFDKYTYKLKTNSPKCCPTTLPMLDNMIRYFGDPFIRDIEPNHIKQFQSDMLGQGYSPRTTDIYLAFARAAFNYLDMPDNPFKKVQLLNRDNTIVRYLTDKEETDLLRAAKDYSTILYQILIVTISTGLRKNNVFSLRRDQIDLTTGVLNLTSKGGRKLILPINRTVITILSSIPDNGSPYFWLNPRTSMPYEKMDRSFATVKKMAGITKPFRWHDLRHHVAVKLLLNTNNIYAVKEMLGHRDVKTTQRYAHLTPGYMKDAVETLNLSNERVPKRAPKQIKDDRINEPKQRDIA